MKETPRHYYYYYYFYTLQSDMITLLLYIIIATWFSCWAAALVSKVLDLDFGYTSDLGSTSPNEIMITPKIH
jgi:hypothetical protein